MMRAPPASSAATYPTFPSKPSGMPHAIVGTPARSSALTIGLPWWDEISSTPSTWPAVTYAVMRALLGRARDHEQQRHLTLGERLGRTAQQDREVRVLEQQVMGLREQERDRVRAARHEAARVLVRGVPRGADRLVDGRERLRGHPVTAVDDPRDGAPRDTRRSRDVADGRTPARGLLVVHGTRL